MDTEVTLMGGGSAVRNWIPHWSARWAGYAVIGTSVVVAVLWLLSGNAAAAPVGHAQTPPRFVVRPAGNGERTLEDNTVVAPTRVLCSQGDRGPVEPPPAANLFIDERHAEPFIGEGLVPNRYTIRVGNNGDLADRPSAINPPTFIVTAILPAGLEYVPDPLGEGMWRCEQAADVVGQTTLYCRYAGADPVPPLSPGAFLPDLVLRVEFGQPPSARPIP
jgi:hypothetical protein